MAGMTDSLPDCLASSNAPGSVRSDCASATRSGMIPLLAATAQAKPNMDMTDSRTITPMIQQKTAFFAEPPSLALNMR